MRSKAVLPCPLCGKAHEALVIERPAQTIVKGQLISYDEHVVRCDASEEEDSVYVTAALSNRNLLAARDAYRERNNLLTSSEIVALRKRYGFAQAELAKILGWGEITVTRYETKAIQDEAHDSLLRIVRDNPLELYRFVKRNAQALSPERFEEVRTRIVEELGESGAAFMRSQAVQSVYLAFQEPSALNGNRPFDEHAFSAVVSYLARHVRHLYKTRLMKMLWYADSVSYKERGRSLTGLVYQHMPMGALPLAHNDLMGLETVRVCEQEGEDGSVHFLVEPCEQADESLLDKEDRAILDRVVAKFKYCSASAVVESMHRERAYTATVPGELISFEFAQDVSL